MSLQIIPFESALVGIERFDTAAHPALGAVLARMQSVFPPAVGDAYAVVTNRSTSAIEVLVMRWSGEAFRKPKNIVHEGFSNPPYEPVLQPQSSRLATDVGMLPENLPERFAMVGGLPTGQYRTVEIDSAIFDDGTIVGPDRYGIVKHVRERRAAVKELLSLVDEGLARGRTIDDIVSDFDVSSDQTRTRVWREMLVLNARRNHSFLDYLRRQRELPPNFPR